MTELAKRRRALMASSRKTYPMTWDGLFEAIDDGNYKKAFNIGDEISKTGSALVMQIAAFDVDISADTGNPVPVTLICKNLWTKLQYNLNTLGGFDASEVHAYLVGEFYQSLPSNVKERIVPVKKYTRIIKADTETVQNDFETTETIWVPSNKEIYGTSETMGARYIELFPTNASRRKYSTSNGQGTWWLRSSETNVRQYAVAYTDGSSISAGATNRYWVVPCFCVG